MGDAYSQWESYEMDNINGWICCVASIFRTWGVVHAWRGGTRVGEGIKVLYILQRAAYWMYDLGRSALKECIGAYWANSRGDDLTVG